MDTRPLLEEQGSYAVNDAVVKPPPRTLSESMHAPHGFTRFSSTGTDDTDGVASERSTSDQQSLRSSEVAKIITLVKSARVTLAALTIVSSVILALALTVHTDRMDWKGWYAIWSVCVVLMLLIGNVFGSPGFSFLFGLGLLVLGQVIPLKTAVKGFGDPLVFAIGLLYVVSKGVQESTVMNYFVRGVLGAPTTTRRALMRLVPAVMALSAFTNNTAIVAMLIPVVRQWAVQCSIPPTQLLMPLSFATILGGMCTTIGTSVNLIVNALNDEFEVSLVQTNATNATNTTVTMEKQDMDLFEIGLVGLPVCVVGAVYMIITAPWLLPGDDEGENAGDEEASPHKSNNSSGSYSTQMTLVAKAGMTASQAGFAALHGDIRLISVRRGDPGSPVCVDVKSGVLELGDVLTFSGRLQAITTVLYREASASGTPGFQAAPF